MEANIEKRISFAEYLKYKSGNARTRVVMHDDFLFGHGMKAREFRIEHGVEVVCLQKNIKNGNLSLRNMIRQFLSTVAENEIIFNNIVKYNTEDGARQFTVITENEYEKQMQLHKEKQKQAEFNNKTRYRKFKKENSTYYISMDVNKCEQLEFCCNIIPREERDKWFFVAIPMYEDSFSEEFKKQCKDIDQEIRKDRKKAIKQLNENFKENKKSNSNTKYSKIIRDYTGSSRIARNPNIVAISKIIANGVCELSDDNNCFHDAPVFGDYGPYLEVHHIKWLANGGEDVLENVVALCPTCHRRMHIAPQSDDVKKLIRIAKTHKKKWEKIVDELTVEQEMHDN